MGTLENTILSTRFNMPQLRDLPGVDTLLNAHELKPLITQHGLQAVRNEIRTLQNNMREAQDIPDWATQTSAYQHRIQQSLNATGYCQVFNLTGTIIHTNLGRALLSDEVWNSVRTLVTHPMNLEYDLVSGRRGDRDAIIEARLQRLTGCEAATVVNNNAAALLLVLNTFALGKNVPVSRGELIEIGGSFRLPELMTRSGCNLLEVGTTNRTHVKDFATVLDRSAMLLKVHPSNYHISGFAQEVSAQELAELAKQQGIPSCVDLGSGTLVDLQRWQLPAEPTPQSVLNAGIDLVTFSGDKLLGSVQAGIIVGDKTLLDEIKANPLKRALRADKITLAILEATLKLYEDPETLAQNIPLLQTLTLSDAELRRRGAAVAASLNNPWQADVVQAPAQIGSGAMPDKTINSISVAISHPKRSPDEIITILRGLSIPVIGRISDGHALLDMRGADSLDTLIDTLAQLPQ